MAFGPGGFLKTRRAAEEQSSTGTESAARPNIRWRLTRVARRALYWRRVMRWSDERGNTILADEGFWKATLSPARADLWYGINGALASRSLSTTAVCMLYTICCSSAQHGIMSSDLATCDMPLAITTAADCVSACSAFLRPTRLTYISFRMRMLSKTLRNTLLHSWKA